MRFGRVRGERAEWARAERRCPGRSRLHALVQAHVPEVDFQAGGVAEDAHQLFEAARGNLRQLAVEPGFLGGGGLLELGPLVHADPVIIGVGLAAYRLWPLAQPLADLGVADQRSEERRVGKECRARGWLGEV